MLGQSSIGGKHIKSIPELRLLQWQRRQKTPINGRVGKRPVEAEANVQLCEALKVRGSPAPHIAHKNTACGLVTTIFRQVLQASAFCLLKIHLNLLQASFDEQPKD